MANLQHADRELARSEVGRLYGGDRYFRHSSILLFGLMLLFWGCDRSDQLLQRQLEGQTDGSHFVSTPASPQSILKSCVSKYQSTKAYQDRAYVKLAYLSNGQLTEDRAPMHVAWKAGGELGLRVYSVVAGPNQSGRWHLSLGKAYPELLDQVLSRRVPERVDLPWLLSEPLVSESLSAGLGGFPPQLDLLLSPAPLSRLVDDAAALSQQEPQMIDGSRCSIVTVSRSGLTYVFWIDERTSLLRRLELPTQLLPQDILTDSSISNVRLSIEFSDATFDQPIDWTPFQPEADSTRLYVSRFVPPPPLLETKLLGEKIPAFRLMSPSGAVAFDSTAKSSRKASVLMWLADHPACLAAAEQMLAIRQQLKQAGISDEAVEYVPIWAESKPPSGMTFEQLQQQWSLPGNLALDRSAAGRDLFNVQEAPTVVILNGQGRLQFVDVRLNPRLDRALAPLVSQVVDGVDVAAELKRAQSFSEVRFRAELAQAAATDASESQRSGYEPYPSESLQLAQRGQQDYSTRIVALAQDARLTVWALHTDGTLQGIDSGLKSLQSYSTQWIDTSTTAVRLLPAPDGKLFALAVPGAIEVFDTKSQQSIRFAVSENAAVTDMQWLSIASSKSVRLVAITTNKQVMLLDPENRQQLSGSCPNEPLAIVSQRNIGDLDGLVVLDNRLLEPLKLSTGAATASASPVKHALPEPSKPLAFRPSHGPWQSSRTTKSEQTLAAGWLADEELALFFLDDQLQPFWHYRLPTEKSKLERSTIGRHRIASAISPANGSTVWAVLDAANTIHLLRGDVMWSDHFRHSGRVSGIALVPSGDRLMLLVASQSTITAYELQ